MESSRENPSNFSRKRKLGFQDLLLFILGGITKTLTVELVGFFSSKGKSGDPISKQAFSKSRMNLRPESIIELNDTLLEEYYSMEHKLYKGHRLLAVDGSVIELPQGEEIRKVFGYKNNNPSFSNCGQSICIYDVLNEIIVDSKLAKYGEDERSMLKEGAKRLIKGGKQRKDIIIADRGFPSLGVIFELAQNGFDFVIRYTGGHFLKETLEFAKGDERDVEIVIDLREIRKRNKWSKYGALFRDSVEKTVKVRLAKIDLGEGKTEFLITTLLDKELISLEDLKIIYGFRWRGEESFKLQKGTAELENISGRSERTIYQDYYAKILMMNLHSIIIQDAEEELNREIAEGKKKLKHENYKVNKNVSYGIIRPKLEDLLRVDSEDWGLVYDSLVKEVKRHIIPVKPGRSYPRRVKIKQKYYINRRRAN
jgi:hypothetical protein